jgi:ABC-type thiamin/hydroxymethylpyrimidine transport system permease subunit
VRADAAVPLAGSPPGSARPHAAVAPSSRPGPLTIVDLVLAATIAAAFAALAVEFALVQESLRLTLGFYGGMITAGVWQSPGVLAAALVRKRWAAFIAQNLFGVAQLLLGVTYGLAVVAFTLSEAIGQEIVFRVFPHRTGDWRVWALAGAVSAVCAQVPNYLFYGLARMPLWSTLGSILVISVPSAVVFTVAIVSVIVRAVKKTRALPWIA